MTATPLPRRVRSITRPRLDKLLADLDLLDAAVDDLAGPKDDLLCRLDDSPSS